MARPWHASCQLNIVMSVHPLAIFHRVVGSPSAAPILGDDRRGGEVHGGAVLHERYVRGAGHGREGSLHGEFSFRLFGVET